MQRRGHSKKGKKGSEAVRNQNDLCDCSQGEGISQVQKVERRPYTGTPGVRHLHREGEASPITLGFANQRGPISRVQESVGLHTCSFKNKLAYLWESWKVIRNLVLKRQHKKTTKLRYNIEMAV